MPNRLTEYLFKLAETFNVFHRDCRVLGGGHDQDRLLMCLLTEKSLRLGMKCLGIGMVDRM